MHFSAIRCQVIGLGICILVNGLSPAAFGAEQGGRPRIGLVLGGGGAKGAAHIGVLRVLDELRIPVDCVAGTSMGALIGATYAAGTPPAEIEREVLAINWSRTVGSEGQRDRTPIHQKLAGATYTNNLDFGLKNGGVRGSGGLLRTQDIEDVLRGLVSDARFTRDFDDLPIPFRAVATDMLAGEMVVLKSGDLAVAMRASMAVPGAFSPVVMDGKMLSDGGLMRNLPVDIARDLCADVVIAVSLQSPSPVADDLASAVTLAGRALDVMINANQNAQLAMLTDRDVSIVVQMGAIGSSSFEQIPDAVPLGRAAALEVAGDLQRYSLPEAAYAAWRARIDRPGRTEIRLADVKLEGLKRVNPDFVLAQLKSVTSGAEVTNAEIAEDTGRIYALGDFEKVAYRLVGPADARTLEISAIEKSWGPDFLRFDLGLAGTVGDDLQANVRADHYRTWLNRRGGEWRNTVQVGQQTRLRTSLYQPLDVRQRFFVQPLADFDRNLQDIYADGDRVASYVLRDTFAQLDFGLNFGTRAQARVGLRRGWLNASRETGSPLLAELDDSSDASLVLGLVYDTRDAVALPTRGTFLNLRVVDSGEWLGGEQDFELAEGVITRSFPWRGDSLSFVLGGGADLDGVLPTTAQFALGGIRTFPGLRSGEVRGESYWFAGTNYAWKLADIQPLFGQALYAGFRLNAGRVGSRIDDVDEGTLYGAALSLAGRTPAGPFLLTLGYVDNSSWQLQFAIGRPIAEGSILDETL